MYAPESGTYSASACHATDSWVAPGAVRNRNCHRGRRRQRLSARVSEWAFGAAILFGQALVKFMSGLSRGGAAAAGPVAFATALVIVAGLAPSLLVLTLTLIAHESGQSPARWLQISHVVLFVTAAAVYLALGTVGEMWNATKAGSTSQP